MNLEADLKVSSCLDIIQNNIALQISRRISSKQPVVLAAAVGTGKTRIAIQAGKLISGNILILIPLSVVGQWESELKVMFGLENTEVSWFIYHGKENERKKN